VSALGVRYQFYIWEFYIDVKVLAALLLIYGAWRKGWIPSIQDSVPLFRFHWRTNASIFLLAPSLYILPVTAGILLNTVSLNPLDNAATLVLATLFDIPAIFVFSVTTVLIEEFVFRGVLLHSFDVQKGQARALFMTNVLWTLFSLSEILGVTESTIFTVLSLVVFYFSVGLFSSALTLRYRSLWPAYSFRVGIVSLTPILLTSILAESDAFFAAEPPLFNAEGGVVSLLLVFASFVLLRQSRQSVQISPK
jgi:membrane protease YdiL (CAAX protease family)